MCAFLNNGACDVLAVLCCAQMWHCRSFFRFFPNYPVLSAPLHSHIPFLLNLSLIIILCILFFLSVLSLFLFLYIFIFLSLNFSMPESLYSLYFSYFFISLLSLFSFFLHSRSFFTLVRDICIAHTSRMYRQRKPARPRRHHPPQGSRLPVLWLSGSGHAER